VWGRGPGRRGPVPRTSVAPFELTTERTRLREFRPDDIDALAPIFADEAMMEFYPHAFSREESAAWIARNLERYRNDGYGLWALELRATGELVGDCGLVTQVFPDRKEVEIGWHVKRELWEQGLATEAAREVARYAFDEVGLTTLISLIRPDNVPSARVAEKLGMRVDGRTTHRGLNHLIYRLDRGEAGE
jgi:RimJ/RimL family protein N-acetyltransferase